jgi:hypothetical protein
VRLSETVNAGVSVVYAPVTPLGGSDISCDIYFNVDGRLHKITGALGTRRRALPAGKKPYFQFHFVGLYNARPTSALAALTLTAFQKELAVNNANTTPATLFTFAAKFRRIEIDLGNKLDYRNLPNSEAVRFLDRKATARFVFEGELGRDQGLVDLDHRRDDRRAHGDAGHRRRQQGDDRRGERAAARAGHGDENGVAMDAPGEPEALERGQRRADDHGSLGGNNNKQAATARRFPPPAARDRGSGPAGLRAYPRGTLRPAFFKGDRLKRRLRTMFKLAAVKTVDWPVTVNIPQDGGKVVKATFTCDVRRCSRPRGARRDRERAATCSTRARRLEGRRGRGRPGARLLDENKKKLLGITYVRAALWVAYNELQNGRAAARKN